MPFTFSHPAVILPFLYFPKKWLSVTGLVLGNIIPDYPFNRYILGEDALYFTSSAEVAAHMQTVRKPGESYQNFIAENRKKIDEIYRWDRIVDQYAAHFEDIYHQRHHNGKASQ